MPLFSFHPRYRKTNVVTAIECRPKPGKRRRACKDCTCGLREQLEDEDVSQRSAADKALAAVKEKAAAGIKLSADDLAEIDFTVEGKASSCGSCYLGDAFRFVSLYESSLCGANFHVGVRAVPISVCRLLSQGNRS